MKFIVYAFLLLIPSLALANSDPAIEGKKAEMFITSLGEQAIAALEGNAGNKSAIRNDFKKLLNKNFDMDTIARFAMGRYWAVATDTEKKQYSKLFKTMIVDVYTERFSEYSGQSFNVKGHKPAGRKDFIVNSMIQGSGQPIKVDWRIRKGRVIDVLVEGVSMSVTQRSEFASIIQRNGGQVASLIGHLEK